MLSKGIHSAWQNACVKANFRKQICSLISAKIIPHLIFNDLVKSFYSQSSTAGLHNEIKTKSPWMMLGKNTKKAECILINILV